jgi:hypothetical protein
VGFVGSPVEDARWSHPIGVPNHCAVARTAHLCGAGHGEARPSARQRQVGYREASAIGDPVGGETMASGLLAPGTTGAIYGDRPASDVRRLRRSHGACRSRGTPDQHRILSPDFGPTPLTGKGNFLHECDVRAANLVHG